MKAAVLGAAVRRRTRGALLFLLVLPVAGARALPPEVAGHLDTFVEERMAAWDTPGLSLVVVSQGEVAHTRGYGVADLRTGEPMTEDTLVMLGSTTKAMTALAVMQLAEEGKIDLDARVTRYLPWFEMADARGADLTVRHLLSHSSGFPWGTLFTGRPQEEELEAYVRSLQSVRLEAAPGERYGYSNDTFTILGQIIAEVTDMAYEDYMQRHVFGPLEMHRTTFDMSVAERRGLAAGHRNEYGTAAPYRLSYTASENPAGRAMTSGSELANYLRMLLAGGRFGDWRLIGERSLAEMWTPVVRADESFSYGLAWYLGELGGMRLVTHPGSTGTSGSRFTLLPEAGLGVAVISNISRPSDPREEVASSVLVATLLFGDAPLPPAPLLEPGPATLNPPMFNRSVRERLVGLYSSAAGPLRITADGEELLGTLAGHAFTLEPHSYTGFIVRSDSSRLDGLVLEFQAADRNRSAWLAGGDRLALMGQWFAFKP